MGERPYHQHHERFKAGVRAAVDWLHKRADSMNDPQARAILNSAAFNLGTDFAHSPQSIAKDNQLSDDQREALRSIEKHGNLRFYKAEDAIIPSLFDWMRQHEFIILVGMKYKLTEAGRAALRYTQPDTAGDETGGES